MLSSKDDAHGFNKSLPNGQNMSFLVYYRNQILYRLMVLKSVIRFVQQMLVFELNIWIDCELLYRVCTSSWPVKVKGLYSVIFQAILFVGTWLKRFWIPMFIPLILIILKNKLSFIIFQNSLLGTVFIKKYTVTLPIGLLLISRRKGLLQSQGVNKN